MTSLPEGARGRALAAGITLVLAAALWAGAVSPALAWYADRQDRLADRLRLAARMEALAATVPALRDQVLAVRNSAAPPELMTENTAALAAAALQERVQTLADATGVRLASTEALPPEPAGALERIGLRVAFSAPYPAAVGMLRGLADSTPPLLVDDLRIQPGGALGIPSASAPIMEVGLTTFAFRAPATTPAPRRP